MPQPDRLLLVVSVLEGRNFPHQSSSAQIIVDARFDGEILTTDPVEMTSTPDINQELAWELDKKTFQHHKLQRSVIKCNVYSSRPSGERENLGYFILEVRPLTNVQKIRWYPLLQAKHPKLKPEISICAYIEDDQVPRSSSSSNSKTSRTPSSTSAGTTTAATTNGRSKHLQPILVEDKGYYQLGGETSSAEIFTLSITLHSAKNLHHIVPSNADLNAQDGYSLRYVLFGVEIKSDTFRDLTRPEFRPERSTIRIRSTIQLLRSFFETFHPIDLTLWTGEEILGQTQIPMQKVVKPLQQKSGPDKNFGVLTEDFQLPLNPFNQRERFSDETTQPLVRVQVKLSQETAEKHSTSVTTVENETHSRSYDRLPSPRVMAMPPATASPRDRLNHHYCLSIDLKSLRNLRLTHSNYLYCRYVYPFLGTSTPIVTHPPLHIPYTSSAPPNEHLLPHGLCIFNFAVNAEQLATHFHHEPLRVEVYSRDQERSERKDQLFGLVLAQLDRVLQAEKQRCSSNVNGVLGWRQTWTQVLPIYGPNQEKSGELLITIVLEDLGPLHLNSVLPPPATTTTQPVRPQSVPPPNFNLDAVLQHPNDDAQLQAAYELQLWKESKELEFEKHLREVEAKKLYELMEAFKEKDRERESLLQKKMKEYGELEKQMKKALVDLEKREKQLSTNEQEVQRMQIDLKREYESKYIEIREASKRLQEQSEHQITMEKSKNQSLDDEIVRLKRSVAEWEKRYREKEHEFFSYKDKQRSTPEVKLQSEINMLTLERNELQRKVDTSVAAAERYKQQWLKALKEYQRLKQREQDQSKFLLQKQQQELEHMRLRYLAAEENEVMKTDHKQLEGIKSELAKLRDATSTPVITTTTPFTHEEKDSIDEHVDQQLGVLIEHRDTLLQTGTYTHNDALIQELERRIQEAMKRKSSGSSSAHRH